ncbi:uncharacterized protein TRIREDRAFT_121660 [Trichoderma reesei QM6a]|jgi:hypothetical protein|uniref:Predicted protein n=2 Tax=Hypocrea jecorina TaxID=51453 RepID=G0RI15_HYPJQ|nr:uncharacterized protein TRIREDRAFT_121660 [Trichoderma reesei QM6a]EGR49186.1 predicted protein [Trichoderma reesei QM6a]ETS02421.1 hypothetical protein M419DRAFT_98310 [Trichoderma reesei RUT C-30]
MTEVVNATPKRKRGAHASVSPLAFSFDLSAAGPSEEAGSPRSSTVVHRFRGLALGNGGSVVEPADEMDVESDGAARKRHKPDPEAHMITSIQPQAEMQPKSPLEMETRSVEMVDRCVLPPQTLPSPEGLLQTDTASTSVDGTPEPQPRKKRAGTPPLRFKKGNPQDGQSDADDEAEVADPLRASLTWHEDEITIYDPDDKDDDGTGINGVGFKPTPALAHARIMKRRQQMAEYRKREENEARNRRMQRRRGELTLSARRDRKSPPSRRVRFMDGESRNLTMKA